MRIDQLKLLAYGPFSGEVLDFSAGQQGLHLVYGPNEAGKSTTLAAIEALLFGMASGKTLDFLHPQADLRIGATLRQGKETLEVVRRKGKAGSLRAGNDKETIEPEVLSRFLGSIDGTTFRQRFGIDYAELVAGGEQVVAGKGEIGNLLFAAGTGLSNLKTIIASLDKTSAELFTARGTKPVLNKLISERDGAIKKRKADELSSAVFESKLHAVEEQQQKLKTLTQSIIELQDQQRQLDAIRLAKTDIQQEKKINDDLAYHRVQKTPHLSEGFSDQRIALSTQMAKLEAAQQSLEEQKKRIEEELAGLVPSPQLTLQGNAIDRLRERQGSVTKALQDRPALAAALDANNKQHEEALRSLGLSEAGYTPLSNPDRAVLMELLEQYSKLSLRQEAQKEALADLEKQYQQHADKGEASQSTAEFDALQVAVRGASLLRGTASEMQSLRAQIEKESHDIQLSLRQLRPWKGELEDLSQLSLPSDDTLRLHESRLKATTQDLKDGEEELRKLQTQLELVAIDIEHLQVQGKVKSEADLLALRNQRNRLWKELCETERAAPAEKAAVEAAMLQADEVADWLRLHSTEVAKLQALEKERKRLETQQNASSTRVKELKAESDEAHKQWQNVLSSLGQLLFDPTELREWRRCAISIQQRLPVLAEKRSKLKSQSEELLLCLRKLQAAIGATTSVESNESANPETGFAILLDQAEQRLSQLQTLKKGQDKRQTLLTEKERQIEAQKKQLGTIELELNQWKEAWEAALKRMPLGSAKLPVEVKTILAEHERILRLQADIEDKTGRIAGIDRDASQFQSDLSSILSNLAVDLCELPPSQALAELEQRRQAAKRVEERIGVETKRRDEVSQRLTDTQRQLQETVAQLKKLCQEAKCSTIEELAQVEKRAADLRHLEEERGQIRSRLSALCGGVALDDFISLANRQTLEELNDKLLSFKTDLDLLQSQRDQAQRQLALLQDELGRLGKSSTAAEAEQESELLLRQIQDQAEEYSKHRIAMFLLQKTIERYREKNQGPVLKRASELFSQLTLQSFAGLHPDVDDSGNTVLKGARGDGKFVEVGQMSEGTCDQLYLALRLASLEYYLEQHQSLPLVIDDLLINFDDARCLAALRILLELSQKTQIIFFTHHEHLLSLAKDNLPAKELFTHYMPERTLRA